MSRHFPFSARVLLTTLTLVALAPLVGCGPLMERESALEKPILSPPPVDANGMSGYGAYLAARRAQEDADNGAAAQYYLRALQADPTNGALAHLTWYYDMAAGHPETAMPMVERAIALRPEVSLAKLVQAIGDLKKADYATAQERVVGLKTDGLDVIVLTFLRGWALVGQGKTDEAAALFKRIGSGSKIDPQVIALADLHSAWAYDLGNKPDLAWAAYDHALTAKGDINIRAVTAALSFLSRQKRDDEAKALVAAYRADHPHSVLADGLDGFLTQTPKPWLVVADARQGMAESLLGLASSLAGANAADSARLFAQLALYLHPDFDFVDMLLGDIEQAAGRHALAVTAYRRVAKDSVIYGVVQLRLADSLDASDKAEEALALLRALEISLPNNPDVPTQLADTLRRRNRFTEAAAAYRRALYLLGEPTGNQWGIYYSLGDVLYRGKQWPQAEFALKRSLELQPNQPEVLNYLGYSWIDRGERLPEATRMIEKAVSLKPMDGYIVDSLGWARYLAGDFKRAVTDLERAVELTPADPQINDHLGDAYYQVGRHDEAHFQWQRAVGLNPEADEKEALLKKLDGGKPTPTLQQATQKTAG